MDSEVKGIFTLHPTTILFRQKLDFLLGTALTGGPCLQNPLPALGLTGSETLLPPAASLCGVVMASPGTPWGTRASLSPTHPQPVVHGHPSLRRILCLVAESFPLLSPRPAPAPERTGSVRVIIGPQAQQSVWSTVGHR